MSDSNASSTASDGGRSSPYTDESVPQVQRYHGNKTWWSVGEFLHQGPTHQSVGLSLGHQDEDTWDLSDSLADLYQAVTQRQRHEASKFRAQNISHPDSRGSHGAINQEKLTEIKRWLDKDTSHGFIRVFSSDSDLSSRLFPCTLSTTAQKICLQLAIPGNSLHVQLSGDVIRRMEPFDSPLAIQNEYLAGTGFTDIRRIQEEGFKDELPYLVRFYAGKPLSDYTYARNQLSTYTYVRKGKLVHQWVRRLCVLSGTRLLIHKEQGSEPTVVQLAKGSVEEVQIKGQNLVLKLTSTVNGERSLYLSFVSQDDYNKWLKKIKKATAKLPSKADLSNCNLEFLPETVFINTELQILILRHNALRERPIEEDIYTIGWLDDLPRFTGLRSLNLSDNQLTSFPQALCQMHSLMELNLASNKLEEIPSQISELYNLQVLHLHNNLLSSLPDEISRMPRLAVIVLAFNRFIQIPTLLLQSHHATFKLDSIIMAGNQISRLPADQLKFMQHIKKIDLRLNSLQLLPTETARFHSLEHITHVDIRENQVQDLDIRAIKCLEYLNCERNKMKSMQLHGASLKNVYASHNNLQLLNINPKPEYLVSLDISHNKLTDLPSWLQDCFFLVHLDVSHNCLKSLPERMLTDAQKLKILKANHNRLTSLPERIRSDTLEELHLQQNLIRTLSTELFIKAHRLRYLNMTRNKLSDLPAPNRNDSFNKLQELYLSFNHLGNRSVHKVCCFPRLRVLHMARNKISIIEETDMEKLELLTELNISSNNLTYLPASLGRHPKLQVLRANCNLLQELPNFRNSSCLKVLEVSSNHLLNVNMTNLMASQVTLLDISANPNVSLKPNDIHAAKKNKHLCMMDMRGQNWSLEDISSKDIKDNVLWQTGLSQTSGIRNKLSVLSLNKPHFNDRGDALFGVFDGGRSDAVSSMLCDIIPAVLKEEKSNNKQPEQFLKYTFLSAHKKLKQQGQKIGAASALVYLSKDERGQYVLSTANVGDSQVVLCRQRKAHVLSHAFIVRDDRDDTKRVVQSGGIITEDGRVAGVTYSTRLLGCSYLYPHVVPDPHVSSVTLAPEDTFFIVANQGLWQYLTPEEAIGEIKDTPDPVVAAKRLQDLAQGYGSRENIAVLVVRLMMTENERSRIKELLRIQRKGQKELLKVLNHQDNLLQIRDGVPKVDELSGIVIDKFGHAKKNRNSRKNIHDNESIKSGIQSSQSSSIFDQSKTKATKSVSADPDVNNQPFSKHVLNKKNSSPVNNSENRLYKKRPSGSSHNSWESVMKKRLSEEVKLKELKQSFSGDVNNSEDSSDDDIFIPTKIPNWTVVHKKHENAETPKEWKEQLEQRLTEEIVEKELEKAMKVKDEEKMKFKTNQNNDYRNWSTTTKSENISKPVALPGYRDVTNIQRNPVFTDSQSILSEMVSDKNKHLQADSMSSIPNEILNDMQNSSHSYFPNNQDIDDKKYIFELAGLERFSPTDGINLSPSESVSSIDVRLHDEVDEIYRLRHQNVAPNSHNYTEKHTSQAQDEHPGDAIRPISPDSLISQDEFVKPPISTANIDRDALLFHQMQMARAQTHSGSITSLDSIQSAPMHPKSDEIAPTMRASSHSIEVLVNIGDQSSSHGRLKSTNSKDGGRIEWGSSVSNSIHKLTTPSSSKKVNFDSNSNISDRTIKGNEKGNSIPEAVSTITLTGEDHQHHNAQISGKLSNKNLSQQLSVNATENSTHDEMGSSETICNDSDSDESIGNVSLEDGYTAIEINRAPLQDTLSMLNVLTNDYDDYPDMQFQQKTIKKPRNANIEIDDYETINDSPKETNVNEDYEEVFFSGKSQQESDIDDLYAKVNKIKLQHIKPKEKVLGKAELDESNLSTNDSCFNEKHLASELSNTYSGSRVIKKIISPSVVISTSEKLTNKTISGTSLEKLPKPSLESSNSNCSVHLSSTKVSKITCNTSNGNDSEDRNIPYNGARILQVDISDYPVKSQKAVSVKREGSPESPPPLPPKTYLDHPETSLKPQHPSKPTQHEISQHSNSNHDFTAFTKSTKRVKDNDNNSNFNGTGFLYESEDFPFYSEQHSSDNELSSSNESIQHSNFYHDDSIKSANSSLVAVKYPKAFLSSFPSSSMELSEEVKKLSSQRSIIITYL